jgi:hypothetical protein
MTTPICIHCTEPVLPNDIADFFDPDRHHECVARAVLGSVAHIEKRCGCFVPGSTENDPPGMTKREAARAAWNAHVKSQQR